ncbi:MAG: UDP-N-acetylmuramate--L-alanine ligase [Clostridia bacterium]|nr:UDP-N-acetylmuramate--L-alanine ligase [Clostridia bacterium]
MATPNTHYGRDQIQAMLKNVDSLFFIGIGGISMSSLARLSAHRGFRVGGSDHTDSAMNQELRKEGIEIFIGHEASHLNSYGAVVYTVAISEDNPEYREAMRRGLPMFSRADYLGYIMCDYKNRIGVSGTHGKSTCTSMLAQIFIQAQKDPTILSGAILKHMSGAYRIGQNRDFFLFEACEYMDSFLDFSPSLAVVLNEEYEHVDYFKTMEQVRTSFRNFTERTKLFGGSGEAVINGDDKETMRSLEGFDGHIITYGIENPAQYRARHISYRNGFPDFDVLKGETPYGHLTLRIPGYHNIYNALAAIAVADLKGLDSRDVLTALSEFTGAERRMQFRGKLDGIPVYDDYGHHPTEVEATLNGMTHLGFQRIICVFQPHTYSRLAQLLDRFVKALNVADEVFLDDVYAAREKNTFGVDSKVLARRLGEKGHYLGSREKIAEEVRKVLRPGDALVIMGAGSIEQIFDILPLTDRPEEDRK